MAKKINITWNQPTIGQPIDDYSIEYAVSGQAMTEVLTGDNSQSYEIVDLTENEVYQLRIAGINSEGKGDYTPIIYHYASEFPSAPLALASGEPANSGDLLLTWNAPEFSETTINNYSVSYTPDGDSTTNINTTNTSYDITNLDCSKNVNISIKASNTSGEGPEVVADFTPFCGTPVVPTSIGTVTVAGETSPTEGDIDTYSVTNNGDAGNLTYAWSIVGGTGSSTTDTCEVTWGPDGAGQVTCTITSGDDAPTDSPASDSLSVTINATPTTPPPTTPPPTGDEPNDYTQIGANQLGDAQNSRFAFGDAIGISNDGSRVAIGSYQYADPASPTVEIGSVTVIEWNGSSWVQVGNLMLGDNGNDNFGRAVAMSDDGNRIIVGAYGVSSGSGSLRIFDWNGTAWVQVGTDVAAAEAGEELGYSVSISADGNRIAAGARSYLADEGATRIYEWDGTDWAIVGSEIVGESSNDDAGWSVMLSASGNHIVIGARDSHDGGSDSGHIRVYEWNGSGWVQMGTDIAGEAGADEFGFDVSISSDGQRIIGGAIYADPNGSRSGSARIFDYNGTDWVKVGQTLEGLAANDFFGVSVSITGDGTMVAIGGDGDDLAGSAAGHVRVYYYNAGTGLWELITELLGELAGDDFGRPVRFSRDGNRIAVGAAGHDEDRGQARIFEAVYPPSPTSILFNNTTGPLQVANDAALQVNNSMTLESWLYVSPIQLSANVYLLNKYDAGSSRSGYRLSYYNDTNAGTYQMRIYVGDGFNTNAFVTVPSADRPSPGAWVHYAAVIDNTLSEVRLYQDGVLVGQDSLNGLESTNNDLIIGGQTVGSFTGSQSLAFIRITKAVRYSTNFTPSYDINDYLDGNDPFFNDVELLITGNGKTDGDTVIVDESNNAFTITNLGTSEYDDVTPPDIPPTPFNITLEDDGTSGFDLVADVSMDPMPAGATGYKIAFDGTLGEGVGTPFTGALLYIQNPTVGPTYSTNDGPPSTGGTATDIFRAFWRSGTIPPTSGYTRDAFFISTQAGSEFVGTVTIQPIDASNNPVGPISNTISVFIFEDG